MSTFSPSPSPAAAQVVAVSTKKRGRRHLGVAGLVLATALATALTGATSPAGAAQRDRGHGHDNAFTQVNLISDLDTYGPGVLVDPAIKNPWGIDFGPTSPLWVSNQFSSKVTVYAGANASTPTVTKVPIEVDAHDPTGMVFNPTEQFQITENGLTAKANFLWNENLDVFEETPTGPPVGQVAAWSGVTAAPGPQRNSRVLKVSTEPGGYAGLALVPATHRTGSRILAANVVTTSIDVFNGRFAPVRSRHPLFLDRAAKKQGLAPYNVWYLKGRVYVAYAFGEGQHADAVSVFTARGRFVRRLVTDGPLASPWGMAIAPHHWGELGGALLVGNVDDGRINAFNPRNGHWLGALEDGDGQPLVNPGLWGLKFGNGTFGTPEDLVFAAGVGDEVGNEVYEHGLVGTITPADDDH